MLPIRFLPHSVNLPSVTLFLNQVQTATDDPGVELFKESGGSEVDTQFVATKQIKTTFGIVTTDVSALATIGFNGLSVTNKAGGVTIYGREVPAGGLPAAIGSTVHMTLVATDALLVPESLSAANNAIAQLGIKVYPYLGTGGSSSATPVVAATSQTIAGGAGLTANLYTGGPVKWTVAGGSAQLLAGIMQSRVNFGLGVLQESSDSDVYLSHVSITNRAPTFDFTTADVEQIAAIGDGIAVSAFAMYFTNVAGNGQRVAKATTSHVAISSTGGMITPANLRLTHKQPGETGFQFTPSTDGTTAALITISTTSAIPTS